MGNEYGKQFKDPRWQRKRLEILSLNGYRCQACDDQGSELHVHHRYYLKDKKVWEYTDEQLTVLCDDCHKSWHKAKDELMVVVGQISMASDIQRVIGYAGMFTGDVLTEVVSGQDRIYGVADFLRTTPGKILSILKKALVGSPAPFPLKMWKKSLRTETWPE